ncbi:hypothetical protein GEV33_008659 [Tenebrio molitor]|uniref:Uncharacterized protein n=1 Tax=Tenebrio molitor TaxID=7067 RepID=A0A8J6LBC7_TENMO|nr:hypothetical protein GEV33_008659 [Tenebrio molitor]
MIKNRLRNSRAHSDSDPNSDHPPDSPSTSTDPAPDTTSDSASDPRLPARSLPYERTRPPPIPPRIPLHPRNPVTPRPALSLRRQEEVPGPTDGSTNTPLISLAAEDIAQVTDTIPGGFRLHQVVPLYIV